jgi:hypothetical protein
VGVHGLGETTAVERMDMSRPTTAPEKPVVAVGVEDIEFVKAFPAQIPGKSERPQPPPRRDYLHLVE